jgi:hypothetical protein
MTAVGRVPEIRPGRGIDARRLAELAGLDGQRVAILLGRWAPSPGERDAIAAVFGRTRDQVPWGHAAPV